MRIRLLLLQFLLHGIFCVSERHAAAPCLRAGSADGTLLPFRARLALISVFCFRCSPFLLSLNRPEMFIPLFYSQFFPWCLLSSPIFILFYHRNIGAYADLSLFFDTWLAFCLAIRLLFIDLKSEKV